MLSSYDFVFFFKHRYTLLSVLACGNAYFLYNSDAIMPTTWWTSEERLIKLLPHIRQMFRKSLVQKQVRSLVAFFSHRFCLWYWTVDSFSQYLVFLWEFECFPPICNKEGKSITPRERFFYAELTIDGVRCSTVLSLKFLLPKISRLVIKRHWNCMISQNVRNCFFFEKNLYLFKFC